MTNTTETLTRTVRIPAVAVTLLWFCPSCGGARGEIVPGISYDGSRRLAVDTWSNACGHVDTYAEVRREGGVSR